jgi:hypothetical protein
MVPLIEIPGVFTKIPVGRLSTNDLVQPLLGKIQNRETVHGFAIKAAGIELALEFLFGGIIGWLAETLDRKYCDLERGDDRN